MPKNTKKEVKETFTLSVYEEGMHRAEGEATMQNAKWNQFSFLESFVPLHNMVQEFQKYPLGTKIEVTMKVKKQRGK